MGRNEKESGGGSEEGGGNEGRRGVDREMKVRKMGEKGKHEMKKPSRCAKGECGGKSGKDFPKNRPKTDPKRGKTRKKWASQGKKREQFLEKSPEIGFETGKSGKNGDFGVKKAGWGSGEKMGFTADFAML